MRGQRRVHGEIQGDAPAAFAAVHNWVRRIPRGRVVTYGQIAVLIGNRLSPRAVGWAMHGCPAGLAWHRVVNAQGGCSTDRLPDGPPGLQRHLLEKEGIVFGPNERLDLELYRWVPRSRKRPVLPVKRRT